MSGPHVTCNCGYCLSAQAEVDGLRRDLADAQARGDAWRDKFNADTDELVRLRASYAALLTILAATEPGPS